MFRRTAPVILHEVFIEKHILISRVGPAAPFVLEFLVRKNSGKLKTWSRQLCSNSSDHRLPVARRAASILPRPRLQTLKKHVTEQCRIFRETHRQVTNVVHRRVVCRQSDTRSELALPPEGPTPELVRAQNSVDILPLVTVVSDSATRVQTPNDTTLGLLLPASKTCQVASSNNTSSW